MTKVPVYEVKPITDLDTDFPVVGIPGLNVVAEATTRSKKAKRWNMIDIDSGKFLCQLLLSERDFWLAQKARSEGVPFNAMYS